MPFPLEVSLSHIPDMELLEGGTPYLFTEQDTGMARGRHEPSPKGLFLWHKEDIQSRQASLILPQWGVWRGIWGTWTPFPIPKSMHVHPVFRINHSLCAKYLLEKNRDI